MSHPALLVIGGVAAGTKAAVKAKRENPHWQVTILTRDQHISYAGCGLPYYLSGVIDEERELLVRSPEDFKSNYDIDILIRHEVADILPDQKRVLAEDLATGERKEYPYDKLIIATGAYPVLPPIPNIQLANIYTLRKVTDGSFIRQLIDRGNVKQAVVIGGGLIGLEVAENLAHRGIKTVIVELADHVLAPFDPEMALKIQSHLIEQGVELRLGSKVTGFLDQGQGKVAAVETSAGNIPADLVVVSTGIRPNVELAARAGVALGSTGAIQVNAHMQTNLPDIYAVGDCAEVTHLVSNQAAWMPMGSIANKAGRVAGANAVGENRASLPGALGTAIVKVFKMAAGKTGLTEKEARSQGYNIETVLVPSLDKAHYYPGSRQLLVKLVAEKSSHRLLGGQVVGEGAIDKTVDILATAISLKARVEDLSAMDLAYAPPFSSAMGPTILAANVMLNKLTGKFRGVSPFALADRLAAGASIIDVRSPEEYILYSIPGSTSIPGERLTERLKDRPRSEEIILICKVGLRAYVASLKLKNMGFTNVSILDGGIVGYPFELQ
ncbi:FAD-dependent oxidoreductase [Desulforamulus ruminis]|uniref:FAD-dependent pyridine nucleotide-disulfide oxidoreductase n=1 Tax=Desulforamulus ruminis (strain ATCC 23193 / DSM 2154 / NCIMB 8452 / DL) TaxID=696281 RepID=F6DKJ5_DESRL|nr:FAD-dependent oxidoreductase [Desulforamulus ruminis]AEG59255.1 FAD-dependent pyridine nucleotide-disulfide oxidoreductase [Desulforamulus ruminis DSM 2154]